MFSLKNLNLYENIISWNFLLIILATLILYIFFIKKNCKIENFDNDNNINFITKKNDNLYDEYYTNYYDELFFCKEKNDFEIVSLIKKTNMDNKSFVLDIGSGTGHHISSLDAHNIKAIGLDKSKSMINKSKSMYPNLKFINGDTMNSMLFYDNNFTHILCLYFTIYYIENKKLFFENCNKWLAPGGYLIIHLVDRDSFNPIIPASDLFLHGSLQNYTDKRITNSNIIFTDKLDYKANFEYYPKTNISYLKETFSNNNDIRVQEHTLYMDTHENIINLSKNIGFNVKEILDMKEIGYDYQYIYILEKSL